MPRSRVREMARMMGRASRLESGDLSDRDRDRLRDRPGDLEKYMDRLRERIHREE